MAKTDENIDVINTKTFDIAIEDVKDTFCCIYLNGWYCAVNFFNPIVQSQKYKKGDIITIEYEGDLDKDTNRCFNIKILPLK